MTQCHRIYTERQDAARNMARSYVLSVELDLFGGAILERRGGRIGTFGRVAKYHFGGEDEAVKELLAALRAKHRRGYRPVG